MCVFTWQSRVDLTVKLFPHSSHLYGFSPVWIRTCLTGKRVRVSVLHFNFVRMCKQLHGFKAITAYINEDHVLLCAK